MRFDLLFSAELLLYDAFLIFCFRVDDFSGRTRLINDDAILSATLNRLCMSGSVSKRSDEIRNPSAFTTCAWRIVILPATGHVTHVTCMKEELSMGPNSPDENRRRGTKEDPRVRGIEDDERFRRLDELRGMKLG